MIALHLVLCGWRNVSVFLIIYSDSIHLEMVIFVQHQTQGKKWSVIISALQPQDWWIE